MADISQTAANVLRGTGAVVVTVTAGVTVAAGDVVYSDSTDSNEYKLAINSSAAAAAAKGIALCGAGDSQPLIIQTSGEINPGGTVAVGQVYTVSTNAGKIAPVDDTSAAEYMTVLGIGKDTTTIILDINASGVATAGAVS